MERRTDKEISVTHDFKTYLTDNKKTIELRRKEIERKGVLGAASPEDRIAKAQAASVQEGVFEATVGADDKAPIYFLERGTWAARAVCRIVSLSGTPIGTGFLVAPGIVLTNNHVIPSAIDATYARAEFSFELTGDEAPATPARFAFDPDSLFVTSPQNALDFSLVAVESHGLNGEPLSVQGWLPLDERRGKILDGEPIVVIQHPNGEMKSICLFDSVCVYRDPNPEQPYLLYTTDTDFGSSGSPAFNRYWQVVALHHAAVDAEERRNGRPVTMNRGIRISSIFTALRASAAAIRNGPADQGQAHPIEGLSAHVVGAIERLTDPATRRNLRPFAAAPHKAPGDAVAAAGGVALERAGPRPTIIRRRPASFYADRAGYDPMFLASPPGSGEARIKPDPTDPLFAPLPDIPDWLARDVTPVRSPDGSSETELRYTHFSIVMSASRRIALLTACNIDGSCMYPLGREDRDPDRPRDATVRPEAAADTWYYDPRVDERHQLGPELYDATPFDYGHLVRRLDPVWAAADQPGLARLANDDTFCMTNCAPHEERFHRLRRGDDGNWSSLEDVVLGATNDRNVRTSVLTGPVFHPRDPEILGVKVPTAFWKIVAYGERGGALRAHGFMLWQTREVNDVRVRTERIADKLVAARKPVPIAEIARLTGLDFGPLFAADVMAVAT